MIENTTNTTNSGSKQDNTFWTSSSLSPNTSYSFRAKAKNGDGIETTYSSSAAAYTLANVPGGAPFSNVTYDCIQINCTANGNPAGTMYFLENMTDGTFSGWIVSTSWTNCGLTPGTTYSFRVKARNQNLVETDWTALGSQTTIPSGYSISGAVFDKSGHNIYPVSRFVSETSSEATSVRVPRRMLPVTTSNTGFNLTTRKRRIRFMSPR